MPLFQEPNKAIRVVEAYKHAHGSYQPKHNLTTQHETPPPRPRARTGGAHPSVYLQLANESQSMTQTPLVHDWLCQSMWGSRICCDGALGRPGMLIQKQTAEDVNVQNGTQRSMKRHAHRRHIPTASQPHSPPGPADYTAIETTSTRGCTWRTSEVITSNNI